MKYLIVSPVGIGIFMAPRLGKAKEVEKVYFYMMNNEVKHLGKDMNKVPGWEKFEVVTDMGQVLNSVSKSDLTIIIDDVGAGELGKYLRDQGYKVIGGSPLTDRIEEERQFATDLMSRIMDVPESTSFQSWDRAIEFVKTNEPEDRLVFKPNDANAPKEYTYLGKDVAELVEAMKEFRSHWKWKEDFQIQRFVKGTEVDFSAYFNGKDYIENSMMIYFENKPIMNDDIGPASGGAIAVEFARPLKGIFADILNKLKPALAKSGYIGQISCNSILSDEDKKPYFLEFCFDPLTEILTKRGWLNYKDVKIGDFALSIDPNTRQIRWKKIVNKTVVPFKGDMVRIGSHDKSHTAIDVMVTPDHQMLMEEGDNLNIVRANDIKSGTKIVRTGYWHTPDSVLMKIPEYQEKHHLGKYNKDMIIVHPEVTVRIENMAKFIGVYLAEGSMQVKGYSIAISQSKNSKRRKEIEEIIKSLGFSYSISKEGDFSINSVQLVTYMKSMGLIGLKCDKKYIPEFFKEQDDIILKSLIHGFALGDGSWHKRTGQLSLFTTSKQLADDLQEVIIKSGKVANILTRKSKGTVGIDKYIRNHDTYCISIRESKTNYFVDKRVFKKEAYEGLVWDVEVEEWHTLLVRRNGKPFFSGNCGRFGYPSLPLEITLLEDNGKTFHDLCQAMVKGESGKGIFPIDKIAVTLSVGVPPYPMKDGVENTRGIPMVWDRKWDDYFFPYYPMYEKGKIVMAGLAGDALNITCVDSTLDGATQMLYETYLPTLQLKHAMWRTDLGKDAKKRIQKVKEANVL